jgi:peptidoglycan/LPS O-acetylase OafA/YrhL
MKKRIYIVDALRGIASLAVCWLHMTQLYPKDNIIHLSGKYGGLGVYMFFVISGFIIPFALYKSDYRVSKEWHIFIIKRIIRIDPPYFVAALMAALVTYFAALSPGYQGTEPDFSTTQFLLHLGYLNAFFDYKWFNPVFWTLAIEFQFYLLISIVFPIISEKSVIRSVGIIILCFFAFIVPSDIFVFKYLCLFSVGIVTFQYFAKIIDVREYILAMTLTSVLLILSLGIITAITGVITALAIAFVRIEKIRIFHFLGAISYSLYLVHLPIGARVVNILKRFVTTDIEYFFVSLCGVLVSIFAAFLFYNYIEKPAQEWSSRIKYRRNNDFVNKKQSLP